MPTEALPVFYLSCLQLLLMESGRPREWVRTPSGLPRGGRTTHWLESEGLYYGEVLGNRSSDWFMVTNVLTFADGDVRQVSRSTELPCRNDWRLGGEDLVTAAEAAKAAVA